MYRAYDTGVYEYRSPRMYLYDIARSVDFYSFVHN